MSFPTTRWTVIDAARSGDERAWEEFAARYQVPLRRLLRQRGLSSEDAEDLAQEVFLVLFRSGVLLEAQPAHGRFRSLLCALARNIVSDWRKRRGALKRGGGQAPLALDAEVPGSDLSEAEFEREWFLHLLALALERLREESPRYHRALELTSLGDSSHAEAAAELGCSSRNVRNLVLRGKTLLGSLLRAEVLRYARSPAEQEAELAYLQRLLSST